MSNLKDWITSAAAGESVEAVVIGEMGWGDYGSEDVPNYEACPKGKVLSWDEAAKYLDYEFDSGYGAPGCQAVYAWTPTRVLYVVQYDGSTGLHSIPRNPIDTMPRMPGG